MSFVDVSESTVTQLKLRSTAAESMLWSRPGSMAASVKRKDSMVAMSGMIMPAPFAMPASRTRVLPVPAEP